MMKDSRQISGSATVSVYGCRRRLSLWFEPGAGLRLRGAAA